MLIPIFFLSFGAIVVLLYLHFRKKPSAKALWRSSIAIGSAVGVIRGVLACDGWYGVEHTGGPLQVPAFALTMLALPEVYFATGTILERHRTITPLSFYPRLALLLFVTTVVFVSAVALLAWATRRTNGPGPGTIYSLLSGINDLP